MATKSNKIVPIVILATVVILATSFFRKGPTNQSNEIRPNTDTLPAANGSNLQGNADSDTQSESLSGLSGMVQKLQEDLLQSEKTKEELIQSSSAQAQALIDQFTRQLEDQKRSSVEQQGLALSALESRLLDSLNAASDYQVNGGSLEQGYIWSTVSAGTSLEDSTLTLPDRVSRLVGDQVGSNILSVSQSTSSDSKVPVVTIPLNSTLTNAKAMTAIIGRVPVGNNVNSPVPFKLITSGSGIYANGFSLPEVERAVWSGYAVGDGTLQCVRGSIQTVTFIFADGTIHSVGETRQNTDVSGPNISSLGWISNSQGIQCIPGKYVSNAPKVIRQLTMAGTVSGFANALSQSQVSTTGGLGAAQILTADELSFSAGRGLGAGFGEWARYVQERAKDNFDAVLVQPGQSVAIHIAKQINVDYDPQGRKIRYVAMNEKDQRGVD